MAVINIAKELNKAAEKIDKVIKSTLLKYMTMVMEEGLRGLPAAIASTYHLVVSDDGYTIMIYTDSELAAWHEFGTGTRDTVKTGISAEEYLSGQPSEVSEEASKFFISGKGTLPAQPTFFPAYLRLRVIMVDEMKSEIDKIAKAF